MPTAYDKLIPEQTMPLYKYAAEGAGEFAIRLLCHINR